MNEDIYRKHRNRLMGSVETGAAVILFCGQAPRKSADACYPFTPNRNFLYLAGISEEHSILYLEESAAERKEILFIPRYDEVKAKWTGDTILPEEAREVSGISDIRFLDEFDAFLHQTISRGLDHLYFDMERASIQEDYGTGGRFARKIGKEYPHVRISNVYPVIASLRVIKDPEEVEKIREAIAATREAILNLWAHAEPGRKEYELEADFNYTLNRKGIRDLAFPTICAGGRRAAVLHYEENNQTVENGEMVLLDLGASVDHYCADISRTFPVNGRFTERQKEIYSIVRLAMDRVFAAIRPGVPFSRLNEITRETYAEELQRIGLIEDPSEVSIYYFHGVSHYLGLDTHDVGSRDLKLAPGMVLTVEPGLYLRDEGIGIRIEDDVLVTEDGMENLSLTIPREIAEIEALVGIVRQGEPS